MVGKGVGRIVPASPVIASRMAERGREKEAHPLETNLACNSKFKIMWSCLMGWKLPQVISDDVASQGLIFTLLLNTICAPWMAQAQIIRHVRQLIYISKSVSKRLQ
jgi:hypothetical protein